MNYRQLSDELKLTIKRLYFLIEFIIEKKIFKNFGDVDEIHDIKKMISSLVNTFTKQKKYGTISKKQLSFLESLEKLEKALKEAKIQHIAEKIQNITFWSFLDYSRYESLYFQCLKYLLFYLRLYVLIRKR